MAVGDPVESSTEFPKIPYEYQAQLLDADKKKMIAQMLLSKLGSQPQGQQVGQYYVAPSPFQHIASALGTFLGTRGMIDSAGDQQKVLRNMAGAQNDELTNMLKLGSPSSKPGVGPTPDMSPMPPQQVPGNPVAAEQAGLGSKFPMIQKIAQQMQSNRQQRFGAQVPYSTPESIAGAGGNPDALSPKPADVWDPIDAPPGSTAGAYQKNRYTGEVKKVDQNQVVMQDMRGGQDILNAEHARLSSTQPGSERVAALKSRETLNILPEVMSIADQGLVNQGSLSGMTTSMQTLAQYFGIKVDPKASGTQLYNSFLVPLVGQLVKNFGSGTAISDKDLAFAKEAAAMADKQPEMAKIALQYLFRASMKEMKNYNDQVANLVSGAKSSPAMQSSAALINNLSLPFRAAGFPANTPAPFGDDPLSEQLKSMTTPTNPYPPSKY